MTSFNCAIFKNSFCIVCSKFVPSKARRPVTPAVQRKMFEYFSAEYTTGSRIYAPDTICATCYLEVYKGKSKVKMYSKPANWRKPPIRDHELQCYFCLLSCAAMNVKIFQQAIIKADLSSCIVEMPVLTNEIDRQKQQLSIDLFKQREKAERADASAAMLSKEADELEARAVEAKLNAQKAELAAKAARAKAVGAANQARVEWQIANGSGAGCEMLDVSGSSGYVSDVSVLSDLYEWDDTDTNSDYSVDDPDWSLLEEKQSDK